MSVESLDTAVDYAVAEGRRAAVDLRRRVDHASRELEAATTRLGAFRGSEMDAELDSAAGHEDAVVVACTGCGRSNRIPLARFDKKAACGACHHRLELGPESARGLAEGAIRRFVRVVGGHQRRVEDLFGRQEGALGTFNLVFFGRTGAGKSSLIEALACGDGQAVSQGESDWTEDVRTVDWRSCRLVDTPGIGGWGRRMARADLEARARAAVETADVVLLCFDSQSQQAGEFQRVADWVHAYGKPVVAILNFRNPEWRMPFRVRHRARRRSLSQSVAEHVGHIRDELAHLGLGGTPIVALSAKRALFARAREPFVGPDPHTLRAQRERHGVEKLARWSNLATLEQLLVTAIRRDAAGLRVGMLRRELRAELGKVAGGLGELERSSRAAATGLDSLVEVTLRVVGYPRGDADDARVPFRDSRVADDLLSELERLRESPFQAAVAGELQAYVGQLLEARLSPLRTRSLGAAEGIIEEGFRDGREVSSEEFRGRAFDLFAMEAVAREVIGEAESFLARKIRLVARDARTDFQCQARGVRVDGAADAKSKRTGAWLDYAKVATSAISTATIFFPPAVIVSILAAVCTMIFGWLGRRARKKAEETRAQARRKALDSARRSVHEAHDKVATDVAGAIAVLARSTLSTVLVEPVRTAVALRLVAREAGRAAEAISEIARRIEASDPLAILLDALRVVEEARHAGDRAASRKVWLGEDWVDDPEGLLPDDVGASETSGGNVPRGDDAATVERLRASLLAAPSPRTGAAEEWLIEARMGLDEDERARGALDELEHIARGAPRVHLVGDYNAGKSSLIRRLLVDSGRPVPADLEIGGAPTTSTAHAYAWEGLLLVDTPGFQSGRAEDASVALRAVSDASVVLDVLQPNLVVGDPGHLDVLFRRDRAAGRAGKLERTIFVINRTDELGPDPVDAPEEFAQIRVRKIAELVTALGARAISVNHRQIAFTASDPFGLTSGQREPSARHYDEHRSWDGVDSLALALRTAGDVRRREWVDIAILHGAMVRMAALAANLCTEEAPLAQKEAWIEGTRVAVDDAAAEASRLGRAIAGRFEHLVRDHAFGLLSEVLGAASEEAVTTQAQRLQTWWEEPGFREEVERWQERARKEIDDWFARANEGLGRRFASAEFRQTFPEITAALPTDDLTSRPQGFAKIVGLLKDGSKALSSRDVLYSMVKMIGGKFAPWGVVKWTARFAAAAKVLGPIGFALELFDDWRAGKAEEKREGARREAVRWVHESTARIIEDVLQKSDEDGVGPVGYLATLGGHFAAVASTFEAEGAARRAEREGLATRRATFERLLRSAEEKSNFKEAEADHA
jgi:predicted GTPase